MAGAARSSGGVRARDRAGERGAAGLELVTLAGNMAGAYIMYFAGEGILALARKYHARISWAWARNQVEELTSPESMDRTAKWFRKWGLWFVLFSRFSAGIRFFVSIIAIMTIL